MQLSKGQNCGVTTAPMQVTCMWEAAPGLDADLSALLLTGGKVRDDSDFVFYNQAASPDGAVQHLGKRNVGTYVEDRIGADLARVRADVEVLAFSLSLDSSGGTLADLGAVNLTVLADDGSQMANFTIADMTTETAAITVEFYRRDAGWKVRAVGQGYHDGLAGLARDFGVSVDEPEPSAPAFDPTTPQAPRIDWSNPPVPAGYEL
ncbi:TerD family protein [Rhodococcus sp. NPDC060086]|uniref:TerD family protein n=1 Tax=Rhodococcus sp. NPDC060086 TaxID=3347055 RepID=UPI003655E8C4